jgi:hypothetical protein
MRRFLVRFIRPETFVQTRFLAGFTITTSGFKFSVHTGADRCRDAAAAQVSRALFLTGGIDKWLVSSAPGKRAICSTISPCFVSSTFFLF